MSLFSPNKLSYLGIDIGNAGVKVVELKNEGGRPRLITYGYGDLSKSLKPEAAKESEDEIASLIREVCSKAKVTTKKVVAAMPNFSVFSSVISLPYMNKKELDQAIQWEAKKFVPLPIEEMNLYYEVVANRKEEGMTDVAKSEEDKKGGQNPKEEEKKQHLKILVVAAPKRNVEHFVNIFKKAELELINLETESFALERALVGNEEVPVMIVDFGSISTDITITDRGIPVLNRSVDTGGATITRRISRNINVDLKRAEQFKRDIGFTNAAEMRGIPQIIQSSIEPIVNEIKYCFDLYSSQEQKNKVEKVILTGGSAFLPNLPEYLGKILNIKVVIGDPWARVIYPVELKPVLDELAPRMSVAVGLAMREIE